MRERPLDCLAHGSATEPDGTLTMMFSDIEASTEMAERLGDRGWLRLLRAHDAIVRRQLARHRGLEVKHRGDGFMLAFSRVRRALLCAIDVQRAITAHGEVEPGCGLRVRIGLHSGDALRDRGDFVGRNVIVAARIADRARGGEILVSSAVRELVEGGGDFCFGRGRELRLKGLCGLHQTFRVLWSERAPRGAPALRPALAAARR